MGHKRIVEHLLNFRADLNAPDMEGPKEAAAHPPSPTIDGNPGCVASVLSSSEMSGSLLGPGGECRSLGPRRRPPGQCPCRGARQNRDPRAPLHSERRVCWQRFTRSIRSPTSPKALATTDAWLCKGVDLFDDV
eukprot:13762464-Heterocapsa_arctica.AAC.1